MQLPRKIHHGENVKTSTFNAINNIIDYLHSQRIVGDNTTIKVSQETSGLTISAIQNGRGANISALTHPFQLEIFSSDSGTNFLSVNRGTVILPDAEYSYEYDDITLPTTGTYNIFGYASYGGNYGHGVFFADADVSVYSGRGFFTFIIGELIIETVDGETNYTIKQKLKSDLTVTDYDVFLPFVVKLKNSATLHDTIQTVDFLPTSFQVNSGNIYVDTHNNHSTATYTGSTGEAKYIYLQLTVNDPQSHDAKIIVSDSTLVFFDGTSPIDGQTDKYNFLIAHISADAEIQQHITGDIVYGQTKDEVEEDPSQSVNETKITSSTLAVSSSDGTNVTTWNIDFAIDDSCKIFKMNEKKFSLANSTYGLVYNGGSSLGVYAPPSSNQLHHLSAKNGVISWVQPQYKVKVNDADTADYLGTKFESTDQTVTITVNTNNKIDLSANSKIKVTADDPVAEWLSHKLESSDDSISIDVIQNSAGFKLDLKSVGGGGKVLVNATDMTPDYLREKITSKDGSITFTTLTGTSNLLDMSGGKVKIYADDTPGFLGEKVRVHDKLINALIFVYSTEDGAWTLTSAAKDGLIFADADGNWNSIAKPDGQGDFALTYSSSTSGFKWVKITDCENACSQESSSSTGA